MRSPVKAVALVALALVTPVMVAAQGNGGMEFGVDMAFEHGLTTGDKFTEIFTPVDLRVGFPVSPAMELEPRLTFEYFKPDNGGGTSNSSTRIDALLGLLWHFSADPAHSRIYVRPFGEYLRFSGGGSSASQFGLGGGIGIKLPWHEDLGWRLEAGFAHTFEHDVLGAESIIFFTFGVSYQEH